MGSDGCGASTMGSEDEAEPTIIVPQSQDAIAGEEFKRIAAGHNSDKIIETVHTYFSNLGEYSFQTSIEPRAFLQFVNDSRLLAEDFDYADAEDITAKLVEDGCDRFDLDTFYAALAKIAFYKYKLAPVDSCETLIEDHIIPLEAEAQAYLANHPWEAHEKNPPPHMQVPIPELLRRCYLFYTEEGQPMVFEDFKLFAQDFELVPNHIALDDLRQLFAHSPRPWMNQKDFEVLIDACCGDNADWEGL